MVKPWYRLNQFRNALGGRLSEDEYAQVSDILGPDLMALFDEMHPSEQAHSLRVTRQLVSDQETDPDLLKAALLHDVGKNKHPLRLWERVIIVLGRALFPQKADIWGIGNPTGWQRPFVIARQHPGWGAEMVSTAGGSRLCVDLIRYHQESFQEGARKDPVLPPLDLLAKLQKADNDN